MEEKYHGDRRSNPKTFIKNLRNKLEAMGEEMDLKRNIRERLGGDAIIWFDIIEQDFQTIEQFERIFLNYYWGQEAQSKVRENLFNGRYNEAYGGMREKYAMRKYAVAKHLEPPMDEQDIILNIARHFEMEICDVVSIHEIRNIERLLNYLRRIDDAKRVRNRYGENTNTQNYRNTRRDGWRAHSNNYEREKDNTRWNDRERNGNNNRTANRTYEKRNDDNRRSYNGDNRRDYWRRNQDDKTERYQNNRRYDQGRENRDYRTNYMSQERREDDREQRYNSNIRTSPGRDRERKSPMRNQGRSPERRIYKSPDQRENTNMNAQNTKNNYKTERQVDFDEIVTIHDERTDKKDF